MEFKIEPIQNPNITQPISRSVSGSKKLKFFLAGIVILLAVFAAFFFINRGSFQENSVDFKIEGPTEVSSGDLATYKITYKNNNKISLLNARLNIFYPADSIVTKDGGVIDVTNEGFDLGELAKGASGEKEFSIYIVGDKGNIKTFKASMSYTPATIRSAFKKESSLATTITSLAVPITLGAPPTAIGGQGVSYLIDYRNQTDHDLENLRFKAVYADNFKVSKYSPQPTGKTQNQNIWDVSKLKKGEGARITIQGFLAGNEREVKTISVTLQKKITTPAGDIYVDFEKSEASSVISTPPISISINLNDTGDYVAHLGDLLRYKLNFKNSNQADITGLNLSVRLEGNMFDFSTVKSDGFFDSRSNTITWNGSSLSSLNDLGPNQSSTTVFEVRLKNSFPGAVGARDSFVKASVNIETSNIPSGLDLDKLSANDELVTRISASPTFSQKFFLNDSVLGSSGPFPPKVNQKTFFTVRWNLVNPSNDVSPAKITATLMPGVSWESKIRTDGTKTEPAYNSRLNSVTWDLGTLPSGVGVNSAQYESDFQISITPSVNQAGQSAPLLKNVRFDGIDNFTKEKISRTIRDISTIDINDSNESGIVQP